MAEQVALRDLGDCVHLMGQFPSSIMPAFFAEAEVMLATLKKDPAFALTVPGKIQSYMACGKPIVAALEGEGARLVRDSGAGLTCAPEDPDALAKAILAMHALPREEREAMGLLGKQYCEANFAREMLVDRLEAWMNELLVQSRKGTENDRH